MMPATEGATMAWFKKAEQPAICKECGVYFKPSLSEFGQDYCQQHRERPRRKARVLAWADGRWEELEKRMLEEYVVSKTTAGTTLGSILAPYQSPEAMRAAMQNLARTEPL
jgi:hypothetical protein